MKEIRKIAVLQAAKVVGALYLLGSAIFFIPLTLIVIATRNSPAVSSAMQKNLGSSSPLFTLLLPLLYGLFGFIFSAIACLLYNFIASKIGGVRVEFGQE
ncbi:MAG: hypothetical protein PHF11_06360 [Candidatus Omnitrophica bacterium]|nr:hypothetical protein [Candidatus Omnitrophota bacterium]